jgi:uncharacterized membrane protein required for colicin V production
MVVGWLETLTPIDYLIVGIIVMALLIGWARGFVEVLSGFLVFVVATFVAGHYTGAALSLLNRMWNLQVRFADVLERRINLPAEAYRVQMSTIPMERAMDWMRPLPLPAAYRETLAQRLVEWSHSGGSMSAVEFITNQLAAGVLSAAIFVVLSSISAWVLAILAKLVSDQIKEIPLVGTADRTLGSAVVGLETAIILSLLIGLVAPMLSMYGSVKLGNAIQAAQLSPYFQQLYHWLRNFVFGMPGGQFFIS